MEHLRGRLRRLALAGAIGLGLIAGPTIAAVAPATPAGADTNTFYGGSYDRASLATSGAQPDAAAQYPTTSADGRFVLFTSTATNLATGLAGDEHHLYVHDRTTGTTALVDVGPNGVRPNAGLGLYLVERGSISDDGRYVAFSSRATNLVSGDTNGQSDVFVRDRQAGTTTRVSTDASGAQGTYESFNPQISADGRYVSFITGSSLDPADTDGGYDDVYRKDRTTGAIVLASPEPATFRADISRMSGNGRWVAYGGYHDLRRYDIETGTTTAVTGDGGAALDGWNYPGGISDDGNRVAFDSTSTNIGGPGDTAGADAFLTDFAAGTTTRYTQAVQGQREAQDTALSRDGSTMAYSVMNRPLVVRQIDRGVTVTYQDGWYPDQPWLSADGSTVAFTDLASLVAGDTNGTTDVYVAGVPIGPDTTPPTVTCAPADGQWHADNVSVGCTASDPGSGLASSGDASFTIATNVPDGTATASAAAAARSVCDVAGNCAQATSTGHKVDRNGPSGIVDPSSQGTFVLDADVPADFSCIDTGSGIASCDGEAAGVPVHDGEALPTAAVGTSTIDITSTDVAGNTGTDSAPFVVTDTTLTGTITRSSGTPVPDAVVSIWPRNADERSAWTTTDADGTYRFSLADSGTGLVNVQVTKDGYLDTWVGGSSRGNADPIGLGTRPQEGNATLAPVPPPDTTAPTVSCDVPSTSAVRSANVTVACTATDDVALSTSANASFSLNTLVADGTETTTAMTSARSVCDTSANCTSVGPYGPFKVDRKAPAVQINFPTEGQNFPLGATINGTDFGCTDLFLVTCTSSNVGSNLPNTAGSHSFTVTGTDAAGRTTSVTRTYNVQTTTLRGLVYSGIFGDTPLSGALVEVWAYNAPRTGPPTATATTSPNGSWSIPNLVPNAPYYARYSKSGYTTAWHGGTATPETSQLIGGEVPISSVFSIVLKNSDTTGPTFSCTPPSTSTWRTTQAVVVPCTASDPSGISPNYPSSFNLGVAAAAGTETANASTNSQVVCDTLGNCATAGPFSGYKFDLKAPTASCPAVGTAWSGAERGFTCPLSDGGIGATVPSVTISTNVGAGNWNANASTNSAVICDQLSNCTSLQITGVKVDRAAPTATCSTAPTTWQAANISLSCTPTDPGAGYPGAATVLATTNVLAGNENSNAIASTPLLCDAVNNCAQKTVGSIKVDRKGPTVTCGAPDGVWHNANISLSCTHSDAGSGLPATIGTPPFTFPYPTSFSASTTLAAGSESASAAATSTNKCDVLNNCTVVSITGNKIDRKAPTAGSCPSSTTWTAANVSITCTASDGGSGLDQASYAVSTNVPNGSENSAATATSVSVCDRVANCGTLTSTTTRKVDRKAPSTSCAGAPMTGSVIEDDIAVTCSAADGGSGLDGSSPDSFALPTSVGSGNEALVSTSSRQICDAVQNCVTAGPFGPYGIDRKAPVVDVATPTDGRYVAAGSSHVADFSCTDLFLASCTGSTPDGDELPGSLGAHTFTVTGTDQAGHTKTVSRSYTVIPADTTPPTVACTAPSSTVANAWRSTQLTIPCTVADSSPLAAPGQLVFTLSTDVPAGTETAAATIAPVQVCDVLGNCASTSTYGPFKVDRKGPSVPCTNEPTGWIKVNASLVCTPSDAGSGSTTNSKFNLVTAVASGSWDGDASTNAKTICDKVGNCTTVQANHLKVDRAGPDVTCAAPPTGWNKDNVAVDCTVADPGVGYTGASTVVAATTLLAGFESANTPGRVSVCDTLGNCTTKQVDGFKVDRKAPAWSCTAADALWHKENVTHACQQSDEGSGLTPTSPAGGARDFTVATAISPNNFLANAVARGGTSCDLVGNCASPAVPGNKIDRKAPSVACPAGDTVWHGDNVTVTCTVTDIGSGPLEPELHLSTTVEPGAQSTSAATAKGTYCDLAANCASVVAPGRYRIDRKAPKITVTAPTEGAVRVVGSTLTVGYTCTDDGVGIAGCTGPVPSGGTVTATVLGPQTFVVEGVDALGNRATTTVNWRAAEAVSGRVLDSAGNGIAGATVSRYAATGTDPAIDSVTTDSTGRFAFETVEPGSYRFGATKAGEYLPRFFGSSTLAGAPASSVDGITPRVLTSVTLTTASSIGGKVTSSATGEGLEGVEISLYNNISNTSPVIAQATTGPDGTWRVAGLPAGTYRYRMVADGHVSEWHVDAATKAASTGVVLATAEQIADLLDELAATP